MVAILALILLVQPEPFEDSYITKEKIHIQLPDMPNMGYGVVGQKGFFDIFTVRFDLLKEEIELKERK